MADLYTGNLVFQTSTPYIFIFGACEKSEVREKLLHLSINCCELKIEITRVPRCLVILKMCFEFGIKNCLQVLVHVF